MSLLASVVNMIGFSFKSEARKMLEEKAKSSDELLKALQEAEQTITHLAERLPERRVHPDDTCPGERRHNHLKGV